MFFNFTLNLQLFRYLGSRLARPKTFALAKAYAKPLDVIKGDVVATRNRLVKQISFSCSTIVLEKLLNDEFDSELKRITIENLISNFQHAIVRRFEEWPSPLVAPADNLVVRRFEEAEILSPDYGRVYRIEESGNSVSFRVIVNNDITYDQNLMIKLINRFRTAGKTWSIYNTDTTEEFKITQFNQSE